MNLVKFDCGCIGFAPDSDGRATIIKNCDNTGDPTNDICFFERHMLTSKNILKAFSPLTEIGIGQIKTQIQSLISDGYKFREIKSLLR